MTFEEWWENKVLNRNIVKDSKKYGISYIKLIAENAWLQSRGSQIVENVAKNQQTLDREWDLPEFGPEVSVPPPSGEVQK